MPTYGENVILDDGSGDSPKLILRGGSNDDDVEFFLDDHGTAGYSDGVIKLCDAGGESRLEIRDSGAAVVASINSDGESEWGGDLVLYKEDNESPALLLKSYDDGTAKAASLHFSYVDPTFGSIKFKMPAGLTYAKFSFDNDEDLLFRITESEAIAYKGMYVYTLLHVNGDSELDGALEVDGTLTVDYDSYDSHKLVFKMYSGDQIEIFGDGVASSGQGDLVIKLADAVGASKVLFVPSVGDCKAFIASDGDAYFAKSLGIGTSSPGQLLHVYDGAADVAAKIETAKVNGAAWSQYQNDATYWFAGIAGGDDYQIRDAGACVLSLTAPDNALSLPGLATESLKIQDAGSASATEQDWIAVEVGGVTGYLRVFSGK